MAEGSGAAVALTSEEPSLLVQPEPSIVARKSREAPVGTTTCCTMEPHSSLNNLTPAEYARRASTTSSMPPSTSHHRGFATRQRESTHDSRQIILGVNAS